MVCHTVVHVCAIDHLCIGPQQPMCGRYSWVSSLSLYIERLGNTTRLQVARFEVDAPSIDLYAFSVVRFDCNQAGKIRLSRHFSVRFQKRSKLGVDTHGSARYYPPRASDKSLRATQQRLSCLVLCQLDSDEFGVVSFGLQFPPTNVTFKCILE